MKTKAQKPKIVREKYRSAEADIIKNKKEGYIYVSDFSNGYGKYISIAEDSSDKADHDVDIKISPRINLRITYSVEDDKIVGVRISKVFGEKIENIHFSTLDSVRILQLLELFSELDLNSMVNKSVVLDESILGDNYKLTRFLKLIATDPKGRETLKEIADNYGLIQPTDIHNIADKKRAVKLFENILNDEVAFASYKKTLGVGKDEEVWQRFFSTNEWILGSDLVKVLDERRLDIEDITDFLIKSYDGFVDIIELKLPKAPFWTEENIPRSELTKAVMQCNRYILETERNINSLEFYKKVDATPIAKPRITLVYERSNDWVNDKREMYRILNSSYSNLSIMTYDHLLERAKRILD